LSFSEIYSATFSPDHATAEESIFSGPIPFRKGTAEIANREVPTNLRKSVALENALQFHHDQKTCKFAGKVKDNTGLYLVSY
jgi:hypothetical protein